MKVHIKKPIIFLYCLILILTIFNFNKIDVKAESHTATAKFIDTVTGVLDDDICPGNFVIYSWTECQDEGATWNSHCQASCFTVENHHEVWYNESYGSFTDQWGNSHYMRRKNEMSCGWTNFGRTWTLRTRCNVCGRTANNQSGNDVGQEMGCRNSNNAKHTYKGNGDLGGTVYCLHCGGTFSTATGACGARTGRRGKTVSWKTYADYISSEGNVAHKNFEATTDSDIVVVKYNSNASITVEQTTLFADGNIIGYEVYENGNLIETRGYKNKNDNSSKTVSFFPKWKKTNITDYTAVQFHIYTQVSDYYLPEIVVVPGSVFTYDPNNSEKNIYNDNNTLSANGKMESTVVLPDQSVVLKDCEFTKKGYYFVGWSLNPDLKVSDLTSASNDASQVSDLKALSAEINYNNKNLLKGTIGESTNGTGAWRGGYTHTLYAIWAPIRYNVDYDKGLTDIDGSMPSQRYRYDENVTLHKHTYTGRNYKITYDNNLPLTYAGKTTASVPHYTLSTENKDGTAPVVKSNLTFKDWNVTSGYHAGHYAENTNLGPADFEFTDEARSLATAWWNDYSPELPSMFLPGYQWNGWYADAKGTTINTDQVESYSEGYTSSPSIADTDLKGSLEKFTLKQATKPFATTFYSKWTPNTYYVVYVDYDGNGSTSDIDRLSSHNKVHTCTYDQLYHYEPDRPSSDEKVFLGWSTVNPDTYTWTKANIEDEPIWVQADGEFTNLTQKQHGVIYLWAVWVKVKGEVNPPENPYDPTPIPDDTNSHLINTNQILIEGDNIYRDPYQTKKWYVQNDTLFSLTFDGISNIDKEYLRKYFMPTQNANNKSWNAANQITKIEVPVAQKTAVTNDATLTNTGSLVSVKDFTANRSIDYTQLNYKQNYTLDADKDNMLINIYPTSKVTFVNPFRKVVAFTANSKESVDKKHNVQIICDSTPTTIMIPEEYDVDENGYVPIIEEDVTIPIKYADFVKNVDPANPEYGSGVDTKNITVTLTQEQTDDGGAPYSQVFKDDTLSEIIKIKESSAYAGEIDLTFSPSKFSEISGFITIKIDITDNVGITVSKEYRFLVMRLETSLKNTVKASKYFDTSAFAQGENGQILIETNGFVDKTSISFPPSLDNLAAEEKSNAGSVESGYWHVGRTLSDTYPRDKDGNIVTVLPSLQTKLWGTTHLGGMQWNGSSYEHSYLTHYFYAPLYTQKGKYPVVVTIYKTDPKDNSKIYNVTKTLNLYIGMAAPAGEGEEQLSDPVPITEEIRDELKDN